MYELYPHLVMRQLQNCDHVTFIHAEELEERFPNQTPKERENLITKEHKAVFIIGLGYPLPLSNVPHDERAADYDDWSTPNGVKDYRGLNGDFMLWNEVLQESLEVSSMGIRVDSQTLESQSKMLGLWEETKDQYYHKSLMEGKFPFTVGGGLGVDRIIMWGMGRRHIGEVSVGAWAEKDLKGDNHILK